MFVFFLSKPGFQVKHLGRFTGILRLKKKSIRNQAEKMLEKNMEN